MEAANLKNEVNTSGDSRPNRKNPFERTHPWAPMITEILHYNIRPICFAADILHMGQKRNNMQIGPNKT